MKAALKYGLILLLAIALRSVNLPLETIEPVCFVLILLFGIPHGAVDHKIYGTINKKKSLGRYITIYILIAGGYFLWWIFMPLKATLAFLLLSTYHFGEELMEGRLKKPAKPYINMIIGLSIFMAPFIYQYNEIVISVSTFLSNEPELYSSNYLAIGAGIIYLVTVGCMTFLRSKQFINNRDLISLLLHVAFINVLYILLPFILAFTIYFICFHSFNALTHQYDWLKKKNSSYNYKSFLIDLSPFSLLSIFGLSIILYWIGPEQWSDLLVYFFVMISLLTLPHAILTNQLYDVRKNT